MAAPVPAIPALCSLPSSMLDFVSCLACPHPTPRSVCHSLVSTGIGYCLTWLNLLSCLPQLGLLLLLSLAMPSAMSAINGRAHSIPSGPIDISVFGSRCLPSSLRSNGTEWNRICNVFLPGTVYSGTSEQRTLLDNGIAVFHYRKVVLPQR